MSDESRPDVRFVWVHESGHELRLIGEESRWMHLLQ